MEIAGEAGARGCVVGFDAQDPGEENRMVRDTRERGRPRQEGMEVAIVAAVLPGVAVSVRRTGTFGSVMRFGNIIVPRIFLLGTFARRA